MRFLFLILSTTASAPTAAPKRAKRETINLISKWKPLAVLIEDKASGQSLVQDLKKEKVNVRNTISFGDNYV